MSDISTKLYNGADEIMERFEAIAEYEREVYPDAGMDCSTGGFVANISVFASGT